MFTLCNTFQFTLQAIMKTEDRALFKEHIERLGERVAPSKVACSLQEAVEVAESVSRRLLFHSYH